MRSPSWYNQAILYEIDVRRYRDSNGDGVGDFRGLLEKLDYLADLGVTCLWLLPFYPSPFRDNGYDITNHMDIEPSLGTLQDFEAFMDGARERGLHVILDLIANHTSNQHPWFQASRRAPRNRFRDYYVWAENRPEQQPGGGTIFPGQEKNVWTYDETAGAYFFHRFYHFQPELSTGNPEVREEVKRIIDFWMAFGVDGFRIDAAGHLGPMLEKGGEGEPHGVLKILRDFADDRDSPAVLLGEVDTRPSELVKYFGDGDQLHGAFNFLLANQLFLAFTRGSAQPLLDGLKKLPRPPAGSHLINFLRNHDELDLEQLTEKERADVLAAIAPEESMRIFQRGTRRRLAPLLGDRRRVELALSLVFSLPGAPCVYYGDEIGMGDDLSLEGRNAVRTPMQWSSEKNAGFSTASSASLVAPVIDQGDYSYRRVNVAEQADDPGSMLSWFRSLTAARRSCPEMARWASQVDTDDPAVSVLRYENDGSALYAAHSFASEEREIGLPVGEASASSVFGNGQLRSAGKGQRKISLPGFGYLWFRVKE